MKKISVVVPCFNASAYLDYCLEHLVRQTIGIENIEIILVNDASTDNGATWEKIIQYENRYPESIIAISLEQNLRQGGARNVGISYASGEYLLFCDADDWLRVEALEVLYEMVQNERVDVVEFRSKDVYEYGDADEENPLKPGNNSYQLSIVNDEDRRTRIIYSTNLVTYGCWNKLYRMSLIKEHEIRFAEHLICEEPSFTLPVRLYATEYVFLDVALYYYYHTPTGTVRGGDWDDRKLDNAKTWIILYEDLRERGFLEKYPAELEYMFWSWGIGLTVKMLLYRGYVLGGEELAFLKQMAIKCCSNIQYNPYVPQIHVEWNSILLDILDMELTPENIQQINKSMQQYLVKN